MARISQNQTTPIEISVDELHDQMHGPLPPIIIDVRTPAEINRSSLPEAHPVHPQNVLEFCYNHIEAHPNAVFAILCHHGVRSRAVTIMLRENDIAAANIRGGIHAWSEHIDPKVPKY